MTQRWILSLVFLVTLSPPAWATPTLQLDGGIHGDLIFDPDQTARFVGLLAFASHPIISSPLTFTFRTFFLDTPETGMISYNESFDSFPSIPLYDPTALVSITIRATGPTVTIHTGVAIVNELTPVDADGFVRKFGETVVNLAGTGTFERFNLEAGSDEFQVSLRPMVASPEPATWLLLSSGLVALAFARRKLAVSLLPLAHGDVDR